MTGYIVLLMVLLLLSGFFSASETAFLSLDRMRIETYLRERARSAQQVADMLAQPTRLLSAILLGNNLVNTAAAAVGTVLAAQIVSGGAAVVAATVVVTVLLVLFGEIGPKTIALQHNWAVARLYATPLSMWAWIARPVVAALDAATRLATRLAGSPDAQRPVTVGDLRSAISLSAESGELGEKATGMLLGALRLPERPLRQIMVHRVDVVAVEASQSIRDAGALLAEHGYLRVPVYEGDPGDIIGTVHVSDVSTALLAAQDDEPVRRLLRPPLFEPEQALTTGVLERMRREGVHIAIVVDEVGAVSGVVTLEDILEEVVGEIRSESGVEQGELGSRMGQGWAVEGSRMLDSLERETGAELPHQEAQTVAGLILAELRRFPAEGETVHFGELLFTVTKLDERRILQVTVVRAPPPPAEERGSALVGTS